MPDDILLLRRSNDRSRASDIARRGLGGLLEHDDVLAGEDIKRRNPANRVRGHLLADLLAAHLVHPLDRHVRIFQAQLRRVGIQMEVRPLASGALRERLRSGEFDAVFDRFENGSRQILRDKWFGPGSPIGYTNPQIVKLLQDAVITFNSDARDQIYRELMTIFREELPMTFLYGKVDTHVAHRRLRGLKSLQGANPVGAMEDLWLEDDD